MATTRRYYTDDDDQGKTPSGLKRLSRAKQREYLLHWFYRNFEDPAQKTPHDSSEGGYLYIWGGPYDANDALATEFGDIVSEDMINEAVEEVESDGIFDWAPGCAHPDMQRHREDAEADDFERSQGPSRRWPTQGVTIAPLTVGEAAGKPLNEPAHITPRFPRGIKDSDLRNLDAALQRETALWWFFLNLEPYDLTTTGIGPGLWSSGYGSAGYGVGPYDGGASENAENGGQTGYAPPIVSALQVLRQEFDGVIAPAVLAELGRILSLRWAWKRPPSHPLVAPPSTTAEAMTAVVPVLESLTNALEGLGRPAVHGGIGHNQPPDESALTEEDRQAVLGEIEEAKQVAQSTEADAPSRLLKLWGQIKQKLGGFGQWGLDRINEFSSEASKEAGKSVGKWLPHYVAAHVAIYSLLKAADQIILALHQH